LSEDIATSHEVVIKHPKSKCTQSRMSRPAIIKLVGIFQSTHGLAPIFQSVPNGGLLNRIPDKRLCEQFIKRIMYQLLKAVRYLHDQGV
jgi:serine/threonine protein kinase